MGTLLFWVLRRSIRWRPTARQSRIAWIGLLALVVIGGVIMLAVALAWQNEVRRLVEMPPIDGLDVGLFLVGTIALGALCILIGRGIRWLFDTLRRLAARWLPDRRALSTALGGIATALAVGLVGAGLGTLVLATIDGIYAGLNNEVQADITEPTSTYRSAGAGSEVSWDQLGRHGRAFVGGGPTAAEISALTGEDALTAVRVYVGMQETASLDDRAAIAVEELRRTGAFDRRVLVVATTTGSGWLEPQSVDSIEYLQGGDTAIVSMQYAYTPSWVSFLFDQDLPVAASEALFEAVHAAWDELPENDRPQLIAYGLSLGAHGMQSVFGDLNEVRERTDGAVFVGSPNSTPLWNELQDAREPGSPAWQPVLDEGREVRWLSELGDFDALPGPWDTPRVAYLQHATDPVTWLSPTLIWRSPVWLEASQRGPDVSPAMRWIPAVTGVQVLVDMLMGESVPANHGHNYGDVILDAWRTVTLDTALSKEALVAIYSEIRSYDEQSSISE